MGTQIDLVAKRKDGSEVMVEIALSPLQDHGLPLVVAAIRDIGAYPRVKQALQRARYSEHLAQLGRLAVDARDPQALLDQVPVRRARRCRSRWPWSTCSSPTGSSSGSRAWRDRCPASGSGSGCPTGPIRRLGFVLAQGRPLVVSGLSRTRSASAYRGTISQAGLTSALAVPLSDRGRTIGVLTVRSRAASAASATTRCASSSRWPICWPAACSARSPKRRSSHAQRLESVGQLTGGIAHDFNNLLTVIQGNLQVLEELPALADDGQRRSSWSMPPTRATRRGAELTSKLLAFSRRQVLQPTPVDVRDACCTRWPTCCAARSTSASASRSTWRRRTSAVLADPGQLESALLNIAINARDAMPDGGTLRFRGRRCTALPAEVAATSSATRRAGSGFVAISIADTGTGMSDEVKERAFEPFFTTKEAGRGTGLGLSTVYGFVKQSSGAVTIDSAPGSGTTVTLYLPAARRGAPAGDADDAADCGELPAGLAVLLVEDDAEVRAVVRTLPRHAGLHASSADCQRRAGAAGAGAGRGTSTCC